MIDPTTIALLAALAVLAWIAYTDLTDARIDNGAVVLLLIAGSLATWTAHEPAWHLAAAGVTFACTFFLWQTDNLGGGDVKMLTMIALCLGAAFPWFLIALGLAAVVVGLARVSLPKIWQRGERKRMVPIGTASFLAFGGVLLTQVGV